MSEYDYIVERQRTLLDAEKWGAGVKSLHAHSITSHWYDTRGNDGSVLDISFNDGSIKREINKTGKIVWFGKKLKGDALLDAFNRNIK